MNPNEVSAELRRLANQIRILTRDHNNQKNKIKELDQKVKKLKDKESI